MNTRSVFALASFLLATCCCSRSDTSANLTHSDSPMMPGYTGPVPSPAAQAALKALRDKRWTPPAGVLGGEELVVVSGFSVTPNPLTGKGPVAMLARPASVDRDRPSTGSQGKPGFYWVPLVTDADCADFVRRVSGSTTLPAGGECSADYRRTLGLK